MTKSLEHMFILLLLLHIVSLIRLFWDEERNDTEIS